jgi:hypothetical protein
MSNKDLSDINLDEIPPDDMRMPKKKVNGCKKGKTAERDICHEMEQIFKGEIFRRVPSSGAFMGGFNFNKNMHINDEAKRTLTGDIITPTWMKFSFESKAYNDTPMFHKILCGEDKDIDKWVAQACTDAAKVDKKMLIIFKITSKRKAFVALNIKDFELFRAPREILDVPVLCVSNYLIYKNQYIIMEKSFFMENYMKRYKWVNDWFYQGEIEKIDINSLKQGESNVI